MDYDLWGRLLLAGARLEYTLIPFGMWRRHADQKTRDRLRQTESLAATARTLLARAPGLSAARRGEIAQEIDGYLDAYRRSPVEHRGRLDRLGLPPPLVRPVRGLRRWLGERLSDSF